MGKMKMRLLYPLKRCGSQYLSIAGKLGLAPWMWKFDDCEESDIDLRGNSPYRQIV